MEEKKQGERNPVLDKKIVRHMDNLGRIVVPAPFREYLGIQASDNMLMYISEDGKSVTFTKSTPENTPEDAVPKKYKK